jgi:hypothetical protein
MIHYLGLARSLKATVHIVRADMERMAMILPIGKVIGTQILRIELARK